MAVKPQNALDIWALGEWFFQMLAEQRINSWVMRTRCFQVWSSFWWLQGSSGLFYAFLNHTSSSSLCLESVRWLHLYNFKLEWPIKNNAIVFLKDRPCLLLKMSLCLSVYEEMYLFYKSEMLKDHETAESHHTGNLLLHAAVLELHRIKPRITPNFDCATIYYLEDLT